MKYKLLPTEQPEGTRPYEKFQNSVLYQFLTLKQRHEIHYKTIPMYASPSQENHVKYIKTIEEYSIKNPGQEILSIQAFACHGMINNGIQVVVTNNFDENSRFYEFILAENNIR